MAARAQEVLAQFCRHFRITGSGEVSEKMALCAMAERLYSHNHREGIHGAKVGSLSVSYRESTREELTRELLRCAGIYLDICRGVK